MASVTLEYVGKIQAQQRPRFKVIKTKDGRTIPHTYEPDESRNFKACLHLMAQKAIKDAGLRVFETAICLSIQIRVGVPSSFSKKKKEQALDGEIRPTKKPDVDNVLKAVMDALNGVWYLDDKQVVVGYVCKEYAPQDGVRVDAWEVKK